MLLEEGLWAIRMAGMVEVVLRGAPDPVSCAGRGHPKYQEGARRPLDGVLEPTFWRPCCVHVWGPASYCPIMACWFHSFPTLGA